MGLRRSDTLGEFLRSRRARIQPADVGLGEYGGMRRVPGLRREELAMLAGVSVDHYIRLEQGRNVHFSEAVLDAVARVLKLNETERQHLYNLARPAGGEEAGGDCCAEGADAVAERQTVRPGLQRLLDAVGDVPAYVIGRRLDVLAWNDAAAAVFTDFGSLPVAERNWARMVFLDEGMRDLYDDWGSKAADIVAFLRMEAGAHPNDPAGCGLVGELVRRSPEFAELWAAHDVREKTHGTKALHHPLVGPLSLSYETLRLPDDPDQALVTYTAEAGSPSADSLRLLLAASERGPAVRG
ncbi:helix-turn-helix domain-containing protein [Streptomyces sp. A7024]|uniref:Helix-turn-helix domain-containing protein n=1 Tax=Streptomyces coryli TaxID=1128680 RepID=A0A6G4U3E2_9ACTN|nr:helix-turn-helix transcriptional regulator [Streptomyces coryli]NGN66684.1 helix-turn-helix domain-containing protein [Streptomyces coryli]